MSNRTHFSFVLMAAVICGLSAVSCEKSGNDDGDDEIIDNPSTVTLDGDLTAHGVVTDVHSAIVEVPVKCDGEWNAFLPSDVEWVQVEGRTVCFEGNQTLRLVFDENHSGADRTTTLKLVTDEGGITPVSIRQTMLWNGEVPSNNSAQWFGDNGLGRGINYEYMFEGDTAVNHRSKFSPSAMTRTNPIFNWAKITELQEKNGSNGEKILSRDAYVENTLQVINYNDVMHDSLVYAKDTIGVKFDLSIAFGFCEFEGHGDYNAKETKKAARVNYLISRSATVYDVLVSPAELSQVANELGGESELSNEQYDAQVAKIERKEANYKKQNQAKYKRRKDATPEQLDPDYLEDWQREVIDAEYDKLGAPDYAGIFSKSFGRLYFNMTRNVQRRNEERALAAVEKIDSDYGPLFVGRGWFGGSINMRVLVDTAYIDTKGKFSGALAGGVNNIFHIEGKVEYEEEATRLLRNSNAYISVYGGTAVDTGNAISAHFNSNNMSDRNELLQILQSWGNSLMETKQDGSKSVPSKAAMQSMQLVGIWTLFEDEEVAKYVRDYMYKKHPNLATQVGTIVE